MACLGGCSRLRVLHCVPHVHLGGADVGTLELVRSLNRLDGIEAQLCVFLGGQAPSNRLHGIENPILLDFQGSHRRPREYQKFRRELRQRVRDWQPDIVHSHLWPACRWTGTALRDFDCFHVWHIRDTRDWLLAPNPRSVLLRFWTRWLIRRIHPQCLAVSRAAAVHSCCPLGLQESVFHIVSSGVDLSRVVHRNCAPRRVPKIGVVASFRPEKGHAVLLRALRQLRDRGAEFNVEMAGTGATLEDSRRLCQQLDLEGSVRFLGSVDDVPGFLATLDLFVLPSVRCEGLPLSVLEAMCARVPVVATDVGGTGEIVQNGVTGYLVRPNDVAALAGSISTALDERSSGLRLVENAYQRVSEAHSSEAVASRVRSIYTELLSRGGRRPDRIGKVLRCND